MQRGRIFSRVPVHGRALAGRAEAGDILLSTQVLQEFYVAVTRKLARDRHVEFLQHLRAQQDVARFGVPLEKSARLLALVGRICVEQGYEDVGVEEKLHPW